MSFIVGLSTMATVIVPDAGAAEPPVAPGAALAAAPPAAVVPLDVEALLPQALTATALSTMAAAQPLR
jgi:hypothetical protein